MPRDSPPQNDNDSLESSIFNFLLLVLTFIFAMIGLSAGSTFSPKRVRYLDSLSSGKIGENQNDRKRRKH